MDKKLKEHPDRKLFENPLVLYVNKAADKWTEEQQLKREEMVEQYHIERGWGLWSIMKDPQYMVIYMTV